VLPSQGRRVPNALERFPTYEVTVLPQRVIVGETLIHHGVSLAFGHRFPLLFVIVAKANVFHNFTS
jgi:hypothetical protein